MQSFVFVIACVCASRRDCSKALCLLHGSAARLLSPGCAATALFATTLLVSIKPCRRPEEAAIAGLAGIAHAVRTTWTRRQLSLRSHGAALARSELSRTQMPPRVVMHCRRRRRRSSRSRRQRGRASSLAASEARRPRARLRLKSLPQLAQQASAA